MGNKDSVLNIKNKNIKDGSEVRKSNGIGKNPPPISTKPGLPKRK